MKIIWGDKYMSVLITGGLGYIGSHTSIELIETGYDVIIIDNLNNSSIDMIDRIEYLTGKKITAYFIDLLDSKSLHDVFQKHHIESVIHFAGYKSANESVTQPLKYYFNNVAGTINLCDIMRKYDVYNLIFSSSAAVYGAAEKLPLTEDAATNPLHPYGRTKLMCEEILKDVAASNSKWKIVLLRYFNPVGAHPSGRIGENPDGIPNNLMPYITRVAKGNLDHLNIYGADYPTKDGTGIRDYIHVTDLACGHTAALLHIHQIDGIDVFNLGTGRAYSVYEVIKTFEDTSGVIIPYKVTGKRPGDVAVSFADPSKANKRLAWYARKELVEMCVDAWRWESKSQLIRT